MNKEVTKFRIRGILAIFLSVLIFTGILSCFSALADNAVTEESSTDITEDGDEGSQCLVLRADELADKLYAPNFSSVELVERDGISVVDLTVTDETNDAFVYVDLKGYAASRYVVVLARAPINEFSNFSIYYHTSARGGEEMRLGEDAKTTSTYLFGNGWQFLEFDMKDEEGWGGSIYEFRLDYLEGGNLAAGTKCEIAAVIFSDDAKAVNDAAYGLMTEIYTPVQTLSDFKESDVAYFCHGNSLNTKIDAIEGNLIYRYVDDGESNDPQAMFDYLGYTEANGMQALTTDEFRYTVIRYSAPEIANSVMELFTLTGSAQSLMEMIRAEKYVCHSAQASYNRAVTWNTMVLDMAEDDGLEENTGLKYGWNREDGDKTFKGFRVDWCAEGFAGYYLEISDFMFYQSEDAAKGMAFALSSLMLEESGYWGEEPEETTKEEETGTGGDIFLPPWNTEESSSAETTEETIPQYENTDEETTEQSEDESDSEITMIPGGIGGSDEPEEEGSEVPFYVACGALVALSVASIATVVTIRIKQKRVK
ncbi:MAG: hypothetical protein IKL66_03775 [Clostridia bacterium]|nr:hypothetical protein [Clostridia bacterium]